MSITFVLQYPLPFLFKVYRKIWNHSLSLFEKLFQKTNTPLRPPPLILGHHILKKVYIWKTLSYYLAMLTKCHEGLHLRHCTGTYSESCHKSKMELFTKVVKSLTIFAKRSILMWLTSSEYASTVKWLE